jgi:hypothetical protein
MKPCSTESLPTATRKFTTSNIFVNNIPAKKSRH